MQSSNLEAMFKDHGFDFRKGEVTRVGLYISYTLHNKVKKARQQRIKNELIVTVSKAIVKGLKAKGHQLPKGTKFEVLDWEGKRDFWYNLELGYLIQIASEHPEDELLAMLHG